jgi:hypothetical protein
MEKTLIIMGTVLLVLSFNYAALAWAHVPDQGDTG